MASFALLLSYLAVIQEASGRLTSLPSSTTGASRPATSGVHQSTTTTPATLLPRDDPPPLLTNSLTCGYLNGSWQSAVTCPTDFACIYYTTPISAPNFGCCSSGVGCDYVSDCLDYGASGNPHTDVGVYLDMNGGFFCGSDQPYCTTVELYGLPHSGVEPYSFYSYGCQSGSPATYTAYQYTTEETTEEAIPTSTIDMTSGTTSSAADASETSSARETETTVLSAPVSIDPSSPTVQQGSVTAQAEASTIATSESAGSSSGLSDGAQIGIGVGAGILGTSLLLGLAFWFWRRRSTRKANPSGQPNIQGQEPQHNANGDHGYYDPPKDATYSTQTVRKPAELGDDLRYHELWGSDVHEVPSARR